MPPVNSAVIALAPASGSLVSGRLSAMAMTDGVHITGDIGGLAPNSTHGLHVHEKGDCSAADATSAGPHWNPEGHAHGMPDMESHLGDLGNMIVREDGKGAITIRKPAWTAGDGSDHDILGKAIVFHANVDDFTDPVGNAGARIGCGVIELALQ